MLVCRNISTPKWSKS